MDGIYSLPFTFYFLLGNRHRSEINYALPETLVTDVAMVRLLQLRPFLYDVALNKPSPYKGGAKRTELTCVG